MTATSTPITSLSFFKYFSCMRDPRCVSRTTYRFLDMLFIAVMATIAGANDPDSIALFAAKRRDWLQKYCRLPEGQTPSAGAFRRLLQRIKPEQFAACFGRWTAALASQLGLKQVAFDGKTMRGSGRAEDGLRALHVVSAWANDNHLSLGQIAVEEKSNEITAIPALLDLLELKDALVTIDAMGCQKKIAAKIKDAEADYVLPVKGNQPGLHADVEMTCKMAAGFDYQNVKHDVHTTQEKGHGRQEKRTYIVIYDLSMIRDKDKWKGLAAVGMCIYERTVKGKTTVEVHYFIGSREMSAQQYAQALRNHWGIENNLHWQLDVTFGEDANRTADRNLAQNLTSLRKIALCLLKRHPSKKSIAKKRYAATLDTSFLEEILKLG